MWYMSHFLLTFVNYYYIIEFVSVEKPSWTYPEASESDHRHQPQQPRESADASGHSPVPAGHRHQYGTLAGKSGCFVL